MTQITRAYIALGSNLGDSLWTLRGALALLDAVEGVTLLEQSSFHSSEALGGPEGQADYWNAVAAIDTTLEPECLLDELQAIEQHYGRHRGQEERWGPRTLDLDLLIYGKETCSTARLEVPHPRMDERRFVLEPLAELASDLRLSNGRTVSEQCAVLVPALHT